MFVSAALLILKDSKLEFSFYSEQPHLDTHYGNFSLLLRAGIKRISKTKREKSNNCTQFHIQRVYNGGSVTSLLGSLRSHLAVKEILHP